MAHEAIFRRWDKLRDWILAEREFLAWITGLEAARRAWQVTPNSSRTDALLMGAALGQAQIWLAKRGGDLPVAHRDFIDQSTKRERKDKWRARRGRVSLVLLVGILVGLIGWINLSVIKENLNWFLVIQPYIIAQIYPYVLPPAAEGALKPGDSFRECAKDCPDMVVVPAGEFMMGSPTDETGSLDNENQQHRATIARPFTVSRFEVTFDDWDACVSVGGCRAANDDGMGRGKRPVIYLSWEDARQYVAWLSAATGKTYRLLTEAEWEYAARAGTMTAFYWGDEIGKNNANCDGCGSQRDNLQISPVGSFKPNAFGLYDMLGNVWEWVEDCYRRDYTGAPTDGSARIGDCKLFRVVRGGSWTSGPQLLRSASRLGGIPDNRVGDVGFRVGRTLNPLSLSDHLPRGVR